MEKKTLACLLLWAMIPGVLVCAQSSVPAPDIGQLKKKPIAVGGGKVGDLLRQWWKDGTASGNAGDFYDNRDGDHSPLNLAPWPQMSAIKYSPADIKLRRNWAAQHVIIPHVTFGNSSTSAPAHLGGSNPRRYYVSQFGLSFLYDEYTKNNLYIYPEHRDHDPGHNGNRPGGEGFGDLYPTNTPYLIISQGSSGSDQPFMRMMPVVLAAFRPDVKKKLTETGALMPTIQMLFRSCNKHLKDPKEYLTGKAHPTVFEGSWVDELAMVKAAHALTLDSLPPMVQMRVLEDDTATNGIDFFDLGPSEVLGYTPACIARIHRGRAYQQRLVVDAGASYDLNKKKLTYTWVILRGDPAKIKIVPKKDDQSVVEITVAYHDRRPIAPGSPMESNRVDIGCFVHNDAHYSAPGFVTVHTLDREARAYNVNGMPLDIAHGMGEVDVRVADWDRLLIGVVEEAYTQKILIVSAKQRDRLEELIVERKLVMLLFQIEQKQLKKAEAALAAAKSPAEKETAKKQLAEIKTAIQERKKNDETRLNQKDAALGDSPRHFVLSRIARLTQDPLFTVKHADWLKKNRKPASEARIKSLWKKMEHLGIAQPNGTLTPLLPGKALADAKWTQFERSQLEWLHASLLAELAFPGGLQVNYRTNYVDHRLSVPREWRDVYRYDPKGQFIGWMRYSATGVHVFNHEGLLAVERDLRGRVVKGRVVRYLRDPVKGKAFLNPNPLRWVPGETVVAYEFVGRDDWRGKRVGIGK